MTVLSVAMNSKTENEVNLHFVRFIVRWMSCCNVLGGLSQLLLLPSSRARPGIWVNDSIPGVGFRSLFMPFVPHVF